MTANPLSGKFLVAILSVLAVPAALFMGRAAAQGQMFHIAAVIGGLFGMLICLTLGERVWWLIPLTFGAFLPPIPFAGRQISLQEVAVAGAFAFFFVRYLMHKQPIVLGRSDNFSVFGYFAWVLAVYIINPVGFSALGAEEGGGRAYFTIVFALLSFVVVSNQKISLFEAKGIIWCIVLGAVVSALWSFARFNLGSASMMMGGPGQEIEGDYTWHQGLSKPAFYVMVYIFSRYSFKQAVSFARPHLAMLILVAIAVGLISGKRAVFAASLLVPIIASMLRKDWHVVWVLSFLAPLFAIVLAMGHGSLYELPFNAQRALSIVPRDWDPDVHLQTESEFRPALREIAMEHIQENPWIGRGGFKVDFGIILSAVYGQAMAPQALEYRDTINIQRFAMTGSWHTTWLGIAADFGIPAALFFALFYIQSIWLGISLLGKKAIRDNWPYYTLVMMLTIDLIVMVLRSWTSGNSSQLPMSLWWQYGILVALRYGLPVPTAATTQEQAASEGTRRPNEPQLAHT
jgi:hypothetical protein